MKLYESAYYRIDAEPNRDVILLQQHVKCPIINTRQLPATYPFLKLQIPTIFDNICYNDRRQPFTEEAKHTEIGHLFEHLLLEYMKLKAENLKIRTEFNGETSWDWSRYGKGNFLIRLSMEKRYYIFFTPAFRHATQTLDSLYAVGQKIGGAIYPTYRMISG